MLHIEDANKRRKCRCSALLVIALIDQTKELRDVFVEYYQKLLFMKGEMQESAVKYNFTCHWEERSRIMQGKLAYVAVFMWPTVPSGNFVLFYSGMEFVHLCFNDMGVSQARVQLSIAFSERLFTLSPSVGS